LSAKSALLAHHCVIRERFSDGCLAIFHGPRCIGQYDANGPPQENAVASAS
jgi:hypothetical protein